MFLRWPASRPAVRRMVIVGSSFGFMTILLLPPLVSPSAAFSVTPRTGRKSPAPATFRSAVLTIPFPRSAVPTAPRCTVAQARVVRAVDEARTCIRLQTDVLTCPPVTEALLRALQRGVEVSLVQDARQRENPYSAASALTAAGVPVSFDAGDRFIEQTVVEVDRQVVIEDAIPLVRVVESGRP